LATLISFEGLFCPIALALSLLLKGKFCDFVKIVIVTALFVPCLIGSSFSMYGDPFAFVKALLGKVTTKPYSVCEVILQKRPIAFIFGTFLSFILPSLIGTVLLITISLPHFLYCLLCLFVLGFVNDLNFERFGGGLAVFGVILGCDQYIWYVLRLLKHWVLILIVEVLFMAGAVFAFDFHVEGKDYSDYALTFRREVISLQ
jgi:hypothetical protein